MPHFFERFRQADSSSTRSHSGLGIGLALVRHLVELHGGTVEAASEGAGKGATFTVQLPLLAMHGENADGSPREAGGGEPAPADSGEKVDHDGLAEPSGASATPVARRRPGAFGGSADHRRGR